MSIGARIPIDRAMKVALATARMLAEHCTHLEIAGSLRRAFSGDTAIQHAGDIDIIAVPRVTMGGLFGNTPISALDTRLDEAVQAGTLISLTRGEKTRTFTMKSIGMKLEVKSTPAETFGVALAIATGPAAFSKALVTPKAAGGMLREGIKVGGIEGCDVPWTVIIDGTQHQFAWEDDFFEAIGIGKIKPHHRTWPMKGTI